ncbi:MAG TPA: precorrin-6y C5,15-methyltransferase (decarboxylating) subunit CbiE [Candidatus Dormibacteraeota bacterium]|jgi:precorrin-6Y C5,15-methyltransferase (decarboxylating)|nr:precorrin-6y C5,15-methyltransferase (decarboxylating) subunit CbiE [Candidatus Dormibacteraeota bacterium]
MTLQPVVVVGVPVAGLVGLDERGREALAAATVLCGARRHLDEVPAHGVERVEIGDVAACVDRLRRRGPEELAVVLATGDPLLFGIGATLVRALGGAEVTVIPAVSAVQEVFARARLPWDGCRLLSAHGRDPGPAIAATLAAGAAAILCDPDNRPEVLAAELLRAGLGDCRAVVAERLGGPVERVVDTTLATVAAGAFDGHSVLLVDRGEAAAPAAGGDFGRPEAAYAHTGGMITRAEVRAVVLSRLRPAGARVIWDVGAGSGSIGIEAVGLAAEARLWSVERDPMQVEHLRENAAAHVPGAVQVVEGAAPEALDGLPAPDRVVIGGHGGRLGEILGVVRARLRPGGRVVGSFATLDGVLVARAALGDWTPEVSQVSIARGIPAGRGLRLRAEDPVYVVSAERP